MFRSILLSALRNEKKLFIKKDGKFNKNSDYFADHENRDVIVLNPFMGGGTTLAEANRLGLKVIGCDLNPVSYWIVRESLKDIDIQKLENYFNRLNETVGQKIKELYSTQCPICFQEADSLYAFWIRYIRCPHCEEKILLYKRTLLNEGEFRTQPLSATNLATVFCPECFALNNWDGDTSCTCSSCETNFYPQNGTYNHGKCSCAHCGAETINVVEIMRSGQKLKEHLVAIEYKCHTCNSRLYKNPDEADLRKLDEIENELEHLKDKLIIPTDPILLGDSSVRWLTHNYVRYDQVFNARQLLAFNYLIQGIQSIPEEAYQNAFFTAFSNSLEYNNMMTPYNFPHRKLHHLFTYHALPLTTTPVENSVWGVGEEGAGTFTNCFLRYLSAKKYCKNPFDKYKDDTGKIQTIFSKETIAATVVDSFADLKKYDKSAWLLSGDSAHLPQLPDQSIDFIITDPPYFDSIHYSELSNFFYVWLKRVVNHPYFSSAHVPIDAEAIVNETMDKGEQEYQALMTAVFRECHRVLLYNGKLIFTYHHKKRNAWWTILMAITNAGFDVVDSFPSMSEYKVNPHIRNKQAMDMDLVLICQKKHTVKNLFPLDPNEIMERAVETIHARNADLNENKLFLHFMGELLKTASNNIETVDFEWFERFLLQFDQFKNNVKDAPVPLKNAPLEKKCNSCS